MTTMDEINQFESVDNIFFCKVCTRIPVFNFDKFPKITVECKCKEDDKVFEAINKDINNRPIEDSIDIIDKIMNHYSIGIDEIKSIGKIKDLNELKDKDKIKDSNDIEWIKEMILGTHGLEPFKYFCNKCHKYQCKKCRLEFDYSKEQCYHENNFDFIEKEYDIMNQIKEINDQINSSDFPNKSFEDINFNLKKSDYILKLKDFLQILFNQYKKYKHINIYNNIKKLYDLLSKIKKVKEKKEFEIDFTSVNSPAKLENENITNLTIKQIKISAHCIDIRIFNKKFDFSNLIKLSLKNNNINDISFLAGFNFDNLEKINLNSNQLDDSMIDKIGEIKAPVLKKINLSYNYFSDFKLFKSLEHFKTLQIFKMETNPLREELTINDMNNEYKLLSLEELYLFNGIFCNETIGILKQFKFMNLKKLDISRNDIESLEFFDHLNFVNEDNKKIDKEMIPLEQIYLNFGEITDDELKHLNRFPNLKRLELRNNRIRNIEKVIELRNVLNENNNKCVIFVNGNPIDEI